MKYSSALLLPFSILFGRVFGANVPELPSQHPSLKTSRRQYDYRKDAPHLLDKRSSALNRKRTSIDGDTCIFGEGCRSSNCRIVSGEHSFIPPDFENGAQRGPCPGLNALANHGYIPRDGIVGVSLQNVGSYSTLLTHLADARSGWSH
jgi:hypothetical protein